MIRKIYVADDEKNIRDLIYAFLSNEGYVIKTFASGDDLFENFLRDPADLVILDA